MLGGESPTLVKYEVDAEGRLARRETLSFAGEGVTSLGGAPVGFAGDKGYLVDVGGFRGFVWDPRTMTITKRFDTRALALGDMPAYAAEGQLILQSDRLFGFVYHTSDKQETVGKEARVLVIDTRTDEVTTIADPRCGGLRYAARMPNGDIYATSDTWTAIVHRLDEARAPAPCMLRIKAGEARFDPDFHVKLSTLTGGLPTGGFIPVGDGEILVRALDEALAPVTPTTTGRDLFGARAWRTWRVTLPGAAPGAPVAALAPNIAGILFHAVDGEVFTNDTAADYGRTTFVRLTGPQGPKAGLEIRGVPFDLLRIR
jgi:hypothetical protein